MGPRLFRSRPNPTNYWPKSRVEKTPEISPIFPMPAQPVILDISSDDEVGGFDDSSTADNFDWISSLLLDLPDANCAKDVVAGAGNDDDVVVVGEVLVKPMRAKTSVPRHRDLVLDDDDDDDCVVLNCDPDKPPAPVAGAVAGEAKGSDEDFDDLLIVGEKGQVACRDYPHSRHLCAKFPFNSTPRESHCDLCHCYVCDELAPCALWGSGVSDLDHCCAMDKSEFWQLERKRSRQLKNLSTPIPKPAVGSLPGLTQLPQTSARPTPVLRPASTCGMPSSFGLPNIISQGRSQRPSSITVPSNRIQPHQVGRLLRACNSTTQSHRNSNLAPSLISSRTAFKRTGLTGRTGLVKRYTYVPSNDVGVSCWQELLNHPLVGKPGEINSINLTESSPHLDINTSSSQPLASSISSGIRTLPALTQGYNSLASPPPTSHNQGCGYSPVVTSESPWGYSSRSRSQNDISPGIHCNTSNAVNSVTPSSQQSSAVTQNGSGSGPNLPCNTSDVLSSITPRIHQPSESTQNFSASDFAYDTLTSMNTVAQSCHRRSADNPQVQNGVLGHESLPSSEPNQLISGGMNSSSLDFDLDDWLPDFDSTLAAQDVSSLVHMNDQPSMPASVDAGMLYFDFETSWKGLAH